MYSSNKEYEIITNEEFKKEFTQFIEFCKERNISEYLAILPKIALKDGVIRSLDTVKYTHINNYESLMSNYSFLVDRDDILSALSYDEDDSFESKFPSPLGR